MNSNIKLENIYEEELGIYLRKSLSNSYIKENGYEDILPRKVKSNYKEKSATIIESNMEDDEIMYKYVESIERMFLLNEENEMMLKWRTVTLMISMKIQIDQGNLK